MYYILLTFPPNFSMGSFWVLFKLTFSFAIPKILKLWGVGFLIIVFYFSIQLLLKNPKLLFWNNFKSYRQVTNKSTESFHMSPYPESPNVNILYYHGALSKTRN